MILFHTADLHLDSPMETHLPHMAAEKRKKQLIGVFARLAEAASTEEATAILICGDLFDSSLPSPAALDIVMDVIRQHGDIDFILLSGNHDGSMAAWGDVPQNLKIPRDGECLCYGDTAIYASSDPAVSPEALGMDKSKTNIVMLHGEVREGSGEGVVDLRLWRDSATDYLALGHYHSYSVGSLGSRGIYVYSGTPAGRGFDECGQKGYVKIEIEHGSVRHELVPLEGVVLHTVEADISDCGGVSAMINAVRSAVSGISHEDMVKVELVGNVVPGTNVDKDYIAEEFRREFLFFKIKDRTTLRLPERDYMHDPSLAGEFVRCVMDSDTSPELRDRVIAMGLWALNEGRKKQ